MTPCIGPYSPVAAIERKPVENASIRSTTLLAVVRSAVSAVVRVICHRLTVAQPQICEFRTQLCTQTVLILPVGRPSVLCGDWPWSR
jgi:hypothetical protein